MSVEYSTSMRMQQHHVDQSTDFALPESVRLQLKAGVPVVREAAALVAATLPLPKSVNLVCREVEDFLGATKPEQRVRCVSQITGALREPVFFENRNTTECRMFLQKLSSHFVFPLLLHCAVRYLHRALATLIRTVYVMDDDLGERFHEAFVDSHIRCWTSGNTGRPTLLGHGVNGTLELKDLVMTWVNCIDSTSCVAIPLFPRVFAVTFMDVLPLLGDSLHWMVENACKRCHNAEKGCTSSGALLGEDLAYVRYGIRVVTTYVHKYLYLLEDVWKGEDAVKIALLEEDISRLMLSTLQMLSSQVLPKDVLNGAGLLVSSLLTLRTCNPSLLLEVCRLCSIPMLSCGGSTGAAADLATTGACPPPSLHLTALGLESNVKVLVQLVCSRDLQLEASKHPEIKEVVQNIFFAFSDNGRFALLRGLLAHLSAPLHGKADSLGALLKPTIPLWDGASSKPLVGVHDIIVPVAMAFCAALHAQETRFLAIQTIDSVVRHISSVLKHLVDILEPPSCRKEEEKAYKAAKRWLHCTEANEPATEFKCRELAMLLCTETTGLACTLSQATELIIGIWDDSTQQVSGPLYSTYNEILAVCCALKRCAALISLNTLESNTDDTVFNTTETLQSILLLPDERRGKYHALLGLLGVLPVPQFLSVLTRYYSQNCDGSGAGDYDDNSDDCHLLMGEVDSLCRFSTMLLRTASNPKVGSIAGEVFAKAAGCILQLKSADAKWEVFFLKGIIDPLINSLLVSESAASLHLDDVPRISNIVTHMITPCLKGEEMYLSILLAQLISQMDVEARFSQVAQSIVEIIHRARAVGRDISAYIHPTNPSFRAVLASLQVQSSDLRSKALCLCVLSTKKSQPVNLWQCKMMEWYISTNMQTGGDSAALQSLLETFKRWTCCLMDSYMNQSTKQKRSLKGEIKGAEEYKQLVEGHCVRMVSCIMPHIGMTAKMCRNLSLTRRVTAMSIYICLLWSVLEFLPAERVSELAEQLFPEVLVEGLLECLLEGWEKARSSAYKVLLLYCDHAPSAVFSKQHLGDSNRAETARKKALCACTYRKAEGEVLRFILATHCTPAAKQAAILDPVEECRRRLDVVESEMVALKKNLTDVQALDVKRVCMFIQEKPLHGSISLCSALLTNAWEVRKNTPAIYDVCNRFLLCCSMALRACTFLVGGGGGDQGGADDGKEADVDCRGHIFDRESFRAEENMRSVVNNTWLTIRASAAAVECMMRLVVIEDLSFSAVREVCHVLIDSLLRTKHNGVMRTVRQALKTVASALIRSRDVMFHAFPAEMIDFLLGPHGVRSNSVKRMLRRSQGLPHAILALLEAEDTSVPFFIFPRAMKSLLLATAPGSHCERATDCDEDVSCGDTSDDIARSQRSNALNVLKFIFENKTFASRTVGSLEEAFLVSTAGFDDPSWGIRNSSLMLFSAVLPRFVGEHPATGGVGANTSLHDIAVRAPRAVAFAYKELMRSSSSSMPSVAVFPLLQMLSMLTPDPPHLLTKATMEAATSGEGRADTDSSRIIHAVKLCGSSSNLMVRAASGVALTSLVAPAHLESILGDIFSTMNNPHATLNALHGALLHVQQFHTFYVGTLHWIMRAKLMKSNATAAMRSLVSRLTLKGFNSVTVAASKLHCACLHCPTIASAFFSVAADTLYYGQMCVGSCVDNVAISNLTRFGLWIVHSIFHSPTKSFKTTRGDHVEVISNATLFLLLTMHLLPMNCCKKGHPVWDAIDEILRSEHSYYITSTLIGHLSHYTRKQMWSLEAAEKTRQKIMMNISFGTAGGAMAVLERVLKHGPPLEESPCMELLHLKTHMEFLATVDEDEVPQNFLCEDMRHSVECVVFDRLGPHTERSLCTTELQTWGIRFCARCSLRHGEFGDRIMEILSYYSHPTFSVQHRTTVATALNDMFSLFQKGQDAKKYRGPFLLIALRLLFDDAHDVRMASCRLVSRLASPEHLVLDHTTCVLSVVRYLRDYSVCGNLSLREIEKFLLSVNTSEGEGGIILFDDQYFVKGSDSDGDDDDDDEDDEVLFEREADNLFMERSFLTYIVGLIRPEKKVRGLTFAVYDEMIRVVEERGSTVLLYATLFDEKP